MQKKKDGLVYLSFLAIVIFLGVNFVAVKFSNQELAPFWGAGLRFFIASILLFAIVKIKNFPLPKGKALIGTTLFGLLAFGLTYALLYWALLTVSSGITSVIFSTLPLFTILIASLIGLEKLTLRGILGSVIVVGGILFVFNEQFKFDVPIISLISILLAVIVAAISGIVVKHFPKSHPISMNAVAMGIGALLLFASSLIAGETPKLPTLTSTYLALGWLVTSSIVAFVLMVWLIDKWNASRVSYTLVITPLVTVVAASMLIGETVTSTFLAGSILVLLGVYIGALSPK